MKISLSTRSRARGKMLVSSFILLASLQNVSFSASPPDFVNIPIPNGGVLPYNTPLYIHPGEVLPQSVVYIIACHMKSPVTANNYLYINSGGLACVGKKINPTCFSIPIYLNGEPLAKSSVIKQGDNLIETGKIASYESSAFISFTSEAMFETDPVLTKCKATRVP